MDFGPRSYFIPLVCRYKRLTLIFDCSLVCQLSEYLIELDALGCDLGEGDAQAGGFKGGAGG